MNSVLVLGVGNTLFSDDGAGILAVRAARERWKGDGVDFDEAMAGGLELLDRLVGYRAVLVVDAAVTGQAAPGEVFLLDAASLASGVVGGAHGADLGTALAVGMALGVPMPRVEVLAIEAADIATVGEALTPAVAGAIGSAAAAVLEMASALAEEVGSGA